MNSNSTTDDYFPGTAQSEQQQLDAFKKSLIQLRPVQDICQMVVAFLKDFLQAPNMGIYLWNESSGAFTVWPEEARDEQNRLMIYDPFLLYISDHDRVFMADQMAHLPDSDPEVRSGGQRLFESKNADMIIPLVLNQSLVGLIYAGQAQRDLHSEHILRRIEEIRSLAVMALSNAILYSRLEGILEHLEEKVKERTRELENAQSQLVQSEKMAMLGVMVAGIAHEVNTPSGVINGSVDNIENNLGFVLSSLRQLRRSISPEKMEIMFRTIRLVAVGVFTVRNRNVRDSFRRKKELGAALEERGIPHSRDLAAFLVENGLYAPAGGSDETEEMRRFLGGILMRGMIAVFGDLNAEDSKFVFKFLREVGNCARNLQNIRNSIRSIVRIVRALKYYSHLDQGDMTEADLHEGLENTLIIISSVMKDHVEVERDYGEIPRVVCNPDELNQVWTNIITNAYQALKNRSDARIVLKSRATENQVDISIRDNGPGMSADVLKKIWDPFFTTKDQGEGSGLGLGIVKGIVEKHNGHIRVNSSPGQGTEFIFSLPLRQPGK
ncbi:MAG: GAF domain-containing sensor histidine kinase [Leptospiraceae bacterium]|nr:GAF domain-containing sensor histidine kinase [Leptospiraceae bacterium]